MSAEFDVFQHRLREPGTQRKVRNGLPLNGIGSLVAMAVTSADDGFLGFPELALNEVTHRFRDG
jgi:hypothetical protein